MRPVLYEYFVRVKIIHDRSNVISIHAADGGRACRCAKGQLEMFTNASGKVVCVVIQVWQ